MTKSASLNRRDFLRMAGTAALAAPPRWLSAASSGQPQPRFAFVGAMGQSPGVHVYAIDGERWTPRQFVAVEAPVSLALHPSGESLYVLHEVSEYQGLPRALVTAYRLDARSGQLAPLGQQPLSLSAILPRHMAVAPGGEALLVAVHGGGAYNLLPILPDGRLGRVRGILKETGCGPVAEHQASAHPQAVLFDTTGRRAIAADLGSDRLSILSLDNGLEVKARRAMPAGSGPRHLALHPAGHLLYVSGSLDGSLSAFAYDAGTGRIVKCLSSIPGAFCEALAMHPTGDFLCSASRGEAIVWRIEPATGALHRIQSQILEINHKTNEDTKRAHALALLPDGRTLIAATPLGILHMEIDPITGSLGRPSLAASLPPARSLALA